MAYAEQGYYQTKTVDTSSLSQPWVVTPETEMSWISVPDLISDATVQLESAMHRRESWTLPDTGFSIRSQMARLFDSLSSSPVSSADEYHDRVTLWAQETVMDMVSFDLEYLSSRCVYPIRIEKAADGHIRCPEYGNVLYTDIVQDNERDGMVKKSACAISDFLKTAPPGSAAFFTSPPGWSGIATDAGKPILFPDTQTYLFRVKHDGSIESATVQTNMSVFENKQFLESVGETFADDFTYRSSRDQIKDIVARVVRFDTTGGFGEIPLEEIVRRMQVVTGKDTASKGMSFSSIYDDLRRIDRLMDIDLHKKELFEQFTTAIMHSSKQVLQGQYGLTDMARLIGSVVLELASRAQQMTQRQSYADRLDVDYDHQGFGGSALSFLQSRPGCNGGGSTVVVSGGGFRLGVTELGTIESNAWEWKTGTCRKQPHGCGRRNVEVGPCDLCRSCQRDYDAGRKK